MKTRFTLGTWFFAVLLTIVPAVAASAPAAPDAPASEPAPAPARELAIVVVESLGGHRGAIDDFDRLDLAFHDIAKQRKWPLKLRAERFAANLPDFETELRLFYRGISEEMPGELTFRAWVTFTDKSGKKDFGIVRYVYQRRIGDQPEVTLERAFRGAAAAIADKLEPHLFPKPAAPKS